MISTVPSVSSVHVELDVRLSSTADRTDGTTKGRREEDGREEGVASPLEDLRALPPVAGDRVVSVL